MDKSKIKNIINNIPKLQATKYKLLRFFDNKKSFTLVELLVVIGILAILTAAVVILINPAEYIKSSRDAKRITDLSSIDKALSVLETQGHTDFGLANKVYVSIPDSDSACLNLGLPTLPSSYSYVCSDSNNYTKIDGTGWIPVNFQSSSALSFSNLPTDPINSTTNGNYYTYVPGGSWELNSIFESDKYKNNEEITKTNFPGVYSVGTNKSLSPVYNTNGLVGYWSFEEGTGTTAYDYSGNGNNGALSGGPEWITRKADDFAIFFDNTNKYINFGNPEELSFGIGDLSFSFWLKYLNNTDFSYVLWNAAGGGNYGYGSAIQSGTGLFRAETHPNGGDRRHIYSDNSLFDNEWHHIFVNIDRDGYFSLFIDGVLNDSRDISDESLLSLDVSSSFYISAAAANGFIGSIDDVRIYNRALSDSEIKAIYDATK